MYGGRGQIWLLVGSILIIDLVCAPIVNLKKGAE